MSRESWIVKPLGFIGIVTILIAFPACPLLLAWGLLKWTNWPWWTVVPLSLVVGVWASNWVTGITIALIDTVMTRWQRRG